ncbi:MAG: DUF2007 domain-containing protein [Oscillospiraceae bacterium]|nr:DUF2007 domain-containing protein [Oscillospiraceae bacterium]
MPVKVAIAKNEFELSMIRGLLEEKGIPAVYEPIYGAFVSANGVPHAIGHTVIVPESVSQQAKELIDAFMSSDEFVFCEENDFGESKDCGGEYEEAYNKRKWRWINIFCSFVIVAFGLLLLALLFSNN